MKLVKLLFKIVMILLAIVLALLIVFIGVVSQLDPNQHREEIEKIVYQQIGQKVTFTGPVELKLFPYPVVHLKKVKIQSEYNKTPLVITADTLSFDITWQAVYSKKFIMNNFVANHIQVATQENMKQDKVYKIKRIASDIRATPIDMQLTHLSLDVNDLQMDGHFAISFFDKKPNIDGKLKIKKLTVDDNASHLDSDLIWPMLDSLSGKLQLNIEKFDWYEFSGENLTANINLNTKNILFKMHDDLVFHKVKITDSLVADMTVNYAKKPLVIEGEINAAALQIADSQNASFSLDGLFQEKLTSYFDGKIEFNVESINLPNYPVKNLKSTVLIEKQSLKMQGEADCFKGKLVLDTQIETRHQSAWMKTHLELRQVHAGTFFDWLQSKNNLKEGNLNITFDGQATAHSFENWLSRLNGHALIYLKNVLVEDKQLDARYVSVLSAMSKLFFPFTGRNSSKNTLLECGVFRFDINQGVASAHQGVGLQTKELNGFGSLRVNLRDKSLSGAIELSSRDPALLQVGTFNNLIYIKGELSNPQVTGSMTTVAKQGGALALGWLTGGLSVIAQKLMAITQQKQSPCEVVLSPSE